MHTLSVASVYHLSYISVLEEFITLFTFTRIWRCDTSGPYEKFLVDEKAQIAKQARQTPLCVTP